MLGILRDLLQGGKKKQNPPILNKIQGQGPDLQQAFRSGGLTLDRPSQQIPQVQQGQGMQPSGARYEDDFTETQALQNTNYRRPQVTRHGYFAQGQGAYPRDIQGHDVGEYGPIRSLQANPDPYSELRRILGY